MNPTSTSIVVDREIDTRGLRCPLPILKAKGKEGVVDCALG